MYEIDWYVWTELTQKKVNKQPEFLECFLLIPQSHTANTLISGSLCLFGPEIDTNRILKFGEKLPDNISSQK